MVRLMEMMLKKKFKQKLSVYNQTNDGDGNVKDFSVYVLTDYSVDNTTKLLVNVQTHDDHVNVTEL